MNINYLTGTTVISMIPLFNFLILQQIRFFFSGESTQSGTHRPPEICTYDNFNEQHTNPIGQDKPKYT